MAERWLAAHASSVQNSRSFAGGNNSISSSQRDPLRASVAHDSAHESEDVPRRTPGLRRVDGPSLIEASPGRSERAFRSGNERLYEAYNDLHALAQDFEKPFDAPAILVVGHQTDGKSGTCVVLLVTQRARLATVPLAIVPSGDRRQWQSSPVATVPHRPIVPHRPMVPAAHSRSFHMFHLLTHALTLARAPGRYLQRWSRP
jgi:hypothetical protein